MKANRTKKLNKNNIHSIWSGPKQVNYRISWCEYTHNLIKCIYAHGQKHQIIPINKTQLSGGQCIFKNRPLFAFAPSVKEPESHPTGCSWHTNTNRVHAGTGVPRLDWVFSASTTVSFHSGLPDASRPEVAKVEAREDSVDLKKEHIFL